MQFYIYKYVIFLKTNREPSRQTKSVAQDNYTLQLCNHTTILNNNTDTGNPVFICLHRGHPITEIQYMWHL